MTIQKMPFLNNNSPQSHPFATDEFTLAVHRLALSPICRKIKFKEDLEALIERRKSAA